MIETATDSNFREKVLDSDVPVIVDFWAPWCGPCKAITPILEEVAKEYEYRIKVVKVNVDNERKTAGYLSIRSIPTIMLFKDGVVVGSLIGAQSKERLVRAIESAMWESP